jgi:hypothetical protein
VARRARQLLAVRDAERDEQRRYVLWRGGGTRCPLAATMRVREED